jgi:hypothetical protein
VPSFEGSRCWGFSFEDIVKEVIWVSRGMKLFRIIDPLTVTVMMVYFVVGVLKKCPKGAGGEGGVILQLTLPSVAYYRW